MKKFYNKKVLELYKKEKVLLIYQIDNKSIRDIFSDILKSNDVIFRSNLFYMK